MLVLSIIQSALPYIRAVAFKSLIYNLVRRATAQISQVKLIIELVALVIDYSSGCTLSDYEPS